MSYEKTIDLKVGLCFFGHQVLWTSQCRYFSRYPNWHTTSLSCFVKKHESEGPWWMQHVISFFFQENVSSQFLFLSFTPLCHLAALLLCLWHHEILWVLSCTIVAIVDMVDIQLSCAFISIIQPSQPAEKHPFQTYARHERNRYEFPHMHLAKVRPDSSTHHQLSKILNIASWQDMFSIACLQWFTSVTNTKPSTKTASFRGFLSITKWSLCLIFQPALQSTAGMVTLQPQVDEVGGCI